MHDKMDHAKTISLMLLHKTKQLDGLMKLLVSVLGILAHSCRDVCFVYDGLNLLTYNLKYTIGSFTKLL